MKTTAQLICETRLRAGMSRPRLAQHIGVSEDIVLSAETGSRPRPENAVKFAAWLERDVLDLWPIEAPEKAA